MAMQSFISVPFKAEKHSGLSEVNGIAKFSQAGIVFEFESKLFGLISDGVKEARIPVTEILDVRFKKGFFRRGAKVEIQARSLAAIAGIPHDGGKITLNIKAVDFDLAQEAIDKLRSDLTELKLEQAKEAAALPPTHTPVSVLFDESEDETMKLK
jgi:hypothetical protein